MKRQTKKCGVHGDNQLRDCLGFKFYGYPKDISLLVGATAESIQKDLLLSSSDTTAYAVCCSTLKSSIHSVSHSHVAESSGP